MGFTDYIRNSVGAASQSFDESSFGPDYWAKYHWTSQTPILDFPSAVELTVLNELFSKIIELAGKGERKRSHRDSLIAQPGQDVLALAKSHRKSPTLSRSSSLSSSSSVIQQNTAVPNERSELLGTLCLLLGEHINKVAQNSTYWSWSVECFSKLVQVYSLMCFNSNSTVDTVIKQYIVTTICVLAAIMAKSVVDSDSKRVSLPKHEQQRTIFFVTEGILLCLLWLVGNEGIDHHMSGECVSYVLSCLRLNAPELRTFFDKSKHDKLFYYPRLRHLRLWRSMWLKVVLECIMADTISNNKPNAKLKTVVVNEIVASFCAEQDSYVRDHYEILFNSTMNSVDAFYYPASPDQARMFLDGLSDVPNNLRNLQRSLLKV